MWGRDDSEPLNEATGSRNHRLANANHPLGRARHRHPQTGPAQAADLRGTRLSFPEGETGQVMRIRRVFEQSVRS